MLALRACNRWEADAMLLLSPWVLGAEDGWSVLNGRLLLKLLKTEGLCNSVCAADVQVVTMLV
jgi:hypothetical protein